MFIIYHNPRCSKSRQALALIEEKGEEVKVIKYLDAPPEKEELEGILKKLGMEPEELIRKNEAVYKEKFKGKTMSSEAWVDAMITYPVLIERPIVIRGDKAVLGRPPENVEAL